MSTLFPDDTIYPKGFSYIIDFISTEEEQYLLDEIAKITLHSFHFQGYEAKRKVASFGVDYSFERGRLEPSNPIPEVFYPLIEKVAHQTGINKEAFKELLITEYPEGSIINWHRDAPPFDVVVGISLLSACTFRLRPFEKEKQSRKSTISLKVLRRSLYVLQGVARTDYQHSILPVTTTRYSITLRTLR